MKQKKRSASLPTRRVYAWRVVLAVFVPLVFLLVTEAALRLGGFGRSNSFWVAKGVPGAVTANDEFARQFFSKQSVPKPFFTRLSHPKPAGTIRIFLLGESAAMGTPDPAYGFGRFLEIMLGQQYPSNKFEVINAAMRGIDSHVIRAIARDCAAYEPDLFIVYAGNNEGIGLHAPDPDTSTWRMNLTFIRFSQWCKTTRLAQLVERIIELPEKKTTQDMDFFRKHRRPADDRRMNKMRENFQSNLEDIVRVASASAPVVLATVAVNLQDCPPLASLNSAGLTPNQLASWKEVYDKGITAEMGGNFQQALEHYQQALKADERFAEAHFRAGRCFEALEMLEKARSEYQLACDWDALPFRADSRLNHIIRQVVGLNPGKKVVLADVANHFATNKLQVDALPDGELFHEHVHPTLIGTHMLASSLYLQVTQGLAKVLGPAVPKPLFGIKECAIALAYTRLDDFNVRLAMSQMTGGPPFLDQLDHSRRQTFTQNMIRQIEKSFAEPEMMEVLASCRQAIKERPQDWVLRFHLGNLCLQVKRPEEAAETFKQLSKEYPEAEMFNQKWVEAEMALARLKKN